MTASVNRSGSPYPGLSDDLAFQHARSIFLQFYQWLFGLRPVGSYKYSPDSKATEIIITSELPIRPDSFGQRPALILGRGPVSFSHLGLNDFDSYDHRTGKTIKTALLQGTFYLYALSRKLLESESLAYYCASETLARREILQKQGGFFDAGQTSAIGAPSAAGSIVSDDRGEGVIATMVSLPFVLPWKSEIIALNKPMLDGVEVGIEVAPQGAKPPKEQEEAKLAGAESSYANVFSAPQFSPVAKMVYSKSASFGRRLPYQKKIVAPLTSPKPIYVRFGV